MSKIYSKIGIEGNNMVSVEEEAFSDGSPAYNVLIFGKRLQCRDIDSALQLQDNLVRILYNVLDIEDIT